MASKVYVVCKIRVESDGVVSTLGTDDVPVSFNALTPGGTAFNKFAIAAGAIAVLWDSTASSAVSFSFLAIESDSDGVFVEWWGTTVAANSHANLRAGLPFMLGQDDTQAYNAAGNFAGASQLITKLLAKNTSGTTANVTVLVQK